MPRMVAYLLASSETSFMAYKYISNELHIESSHEWQPVRKFLTGEDPCYLYSQQNIAHRIEVLRTSFLNHRPEVFFAMKANFYGPLLQFLNSQNVGFDTVSFGEIEMAREHGATGQKIIFSGVGKTKSEIQKALALGIRQFNVESLPELTRVSEIARQNQMRARVALRINPNVETSTHRYIQTGLEQNKFGIDLAQIPAALEIVRVAGNLDLNGLAVHIGSQILDVEEFRPAFEKLVATANELRAQGFKISSLDLGGGLGINYEHESEELDLGRMRAYAKLIEEVIPKDFQIALEPGRWLVARAGCLLTEVQYVKQTQHRTFVIVNTGMHHLLRPALYQANHRILPLRSAAHQSRVVDVVGPICESSDVLAENINLPECKEGDWLAILDVGAYGRSMASEYNRHPFPREFWIS